MRNLTDREQGLVIFATWMFVTAAVAFRMMELFA